MDLRTGRSHLHSVLPCTDGTVKFLLQLADGRVVEAVAIPASKTEISQLVACISSQASRQRSSYNRKLVSAQVGCAMGCSFCATGQGGFGRNLDAHEIIDQVMTIQEQMRQEVTHVGNV